MARPAAMLPDDLLAEILSRLPAKSLVRFRCVAKSWLDLLSSPAYQKKFLRPASGLFFSFWGFRYIEYISLSEEDDETINTTLRFLPNRSSLQIIYCCNGLLLCRSCYASDQSRHECYYVCNPATRVYAAIPPPGGKAKEWTPIPTLIALGFDPQLSHHYHVLGFDSSFGLMIFSSKTGEWMQSQVCWSSDAKKDHIPDAVYVHGIFHVTNGLNQVLRVDLLGKLCGRIELPRGSAQQRCVTHSQGYMHCLAKCLDNIEVWILKDYPHGEWVMAHSFSIKGMVEERPSLYADTFDMELHPDANVVFLVTRRNVFSYHIATGELKKIWKLHYLYSQKPIAYSPHLSDVSSNEDA